MVKCYTKKEGVQCVGIIMDGNRRWACENNLPTFEGHRRGYEKFKEVVGWAKELNIKHLIFYAFSTENWKRTATEVEYLMDLFEGIFIKGLEVVQQKDIRVFFIGQRERFSKEMQKKMSIMEEETAGHTSGTVTIALSYGGRAEIVDAINTLIKDVKENRDKLVTEKELRRYMWSSDIPDPDVIIRTGGEIRLSNFLTWQSVYSELYFLDTYWPDFTKKEFEEILKEYYTRERRLGA